MVEYEKRYREVKRYQLHLLNWIQSFFLLQAAVRTLDFEKLVRTTDNLVYSDMKEKIQELLTDSCGKHSGGVSIKEECYYTNHKGYHKKYGSYKKGNNLENQRVN